MPLNLIFFFPRLVRKGTCSSGEGEVRGRRAVPVRSWPAQTPRDKHAGATWLSAENQVTQRPLNPALSTSKVTCVLLSVILQCGSPTVVYARQVVVNRQRMCLTNPCRGIPTCARPCMTLHDLAPGLGAASGRSARRASNNHRFK